MPPFYFPFDERAIAVLDARCIVFWLTCGRIEGRSQRLYRTEGGDRWGDEGGASMAEGTEML